MKRITYLLVVVMLLACLPLTAFAAKAGETATVNFTASHPGITGFGATLNYDATALEIVSVSYAFGTGHRVGNNVGVMSASTHTGSSLFSVTFKILDGAKAGETYKVTATCTEAYDENVEEISMSISGGSVKIDDCDHNYVKDTAASSDATCGDPGKLVEVCSVCGDTKTTTLDPTGKHNHVKDTAASSDPTCGDPGKLVEVCSVCGDTKTTTLDPTGKHTYKYTDLENGKHKVECTVCDYEDTEPHDITKKDNGDGTVTKRCTKCPYTWTGHDVPDTGDITSQVVMTGAVALVVMMGAVALVFKRKTAK